MNHTSIDTKKATEDILMACSFLLVAGVAAVSVYTLMPASESKLASMNTAAVSCLEESIQKMPVLFGSEITISNEMARKAFGCARVIEHERGQNNLSRVNERQRQILLARKE